MSWLAKKLSPNSGDNTRGAQDNTRGAVDNTKGAPAKKKGSSSAAKNIARKVGRKVFLALGGWKTVGIVAVAVFLIFGAVSVLAPAGAVATSWIGNAAANIPSWLMPDRIMDKEQQEDIKELRSDSQGNQLYDFVDKCTTQGQENLDPIMIMAAEGVEQGTKADYAEAWITYVTTTVEGRSAAIYHHPELRQSYEGDVWTPEEIQERGIKVYTRDEIYGLYAKYLDVVGPHGTPQNFVAQLSPTSSNPEGFPQQIATTMWALADSKTTPDADADQLVQDVLDACDLN